MALNRLRTIRQAARDGGGESPFSEHSLRWFIFQSPQNGFNKVIRRVGRRIYLDLDELEAWIDRQSSEVGGAA
jgi:hypothetical protein